VAADDVDVDERTVCCEHDVGVMAVGWQTPPEEKEFTE
jgi:hypothetical protein